VIDPTFRSEGAAVADVNRDGKLDILVGDLWYEAPEWKQHPIRALGKYNWENGYSKAFLVFASDVDGDGWPDQIVMGFPGQPCLWYQNPGKEDRPWREGHIAPRTCNEQPLVVDLLGNGKLVPVFGDAATGTMYWYSPGADPFKPWDAHAISAPKSPGTANFSHGLGTGDVNGDGRLDVLVKEGWWEAPVDRAQSPWTFHKANLGQDCAQLAVWDVNGDGRRDVVTSSAHRYGVWWHEQNADGSFSQRLVHDKVSQTHALALADINRDGVPDIVTGKRFWAHNGKDPGEKEPAILCWYERTLAGGKLDWVQHVVSEESGVGMQIIVVDLNADGKDDFVVSNKKGVQILLQR
jgi:hypothetical protein